jgi:hypothetical protein
LWRRTVNTKIVPLGDTILGKLLVLLCFKNLKNLETQVSAVMPRKGPPIVHENSN